MLHLAYRLDVFAHSAQFLTKKARLDFKSITENSRVALHVAEIDVLESGAPMSSPTWLKLRYPGQIDPGYWCLLPQKNENR
jgi:hypothetical protein